MNKVFQEQNDHASIVYIEPLLILATKTILCNSLKTGFEQLQDNQLYASPGNESSSKNTGLACFLESMKSE